MSRIRSRITFANVISMIALFVALGGTGYAAATLAKNSVKAKQIAKNAVRSGEVKNRSLRPRDINLPMMVEQLPEAMKGEQGPPGQDGTADAFARVQANGTLQPDVTGFAPQNKGNISVVKGEGGAATGNYCFDLPDAQVASALVSLDNADAAAADRNLVASVAIDRGEDLGDCPATHNDARVRVVDGNTGAAQDARFFIWFDLP